jgi:hypothetical protein
MLMIFLPQTAETRIPHVPRSGIPAMNNISCLPLGPLSDVSGIPALEGLFGTVVGQGTKSFHKAYAIVLFVSYKGRAF